MQSDYDCIMKIQRLTTKRIEWKFYKLNNIWLLKTYLSPGPSSLNILQGMGFLKKLGRDAQSIIYL